MEIGEFIVNKKKGESFELREKLGSGTFSDVWLAIRSSDNQQVALKVILPIKDYYIQDAKKYETRLLKKVKDIPGTITLLDSFSFNYHHEKSDKNKRYFIFVFNVLGKSMYQFLKHDLDFKPNFPLFLFLKIAREFIETLDKLHNDVHMIHTDLKPENLVFTNRDFSLDDKTGFKTTTTSTKTSTKTFMTTLIDFGSAVIEGKDHKGSIISTRQYRAPEVILGNKWSYPSDIWSYGCILVELLTGNLLFKTHNSLEHLNLMEYKLQEKIPTSQILMMDSKTRRKYFHQDPFKNNYFLKRMDFSKTNSPTLKEMIFSRTLKTRISKSSGVSRKDMKILNNFFETLYDFIQKCLIMDPKKRITARQALSHPLFRKYL
jgi:dual-specificity kinase